MPKVSELIEFLHKSYAPDDLITWDIWETADIQDVACGAGTPLTEQEARKILSAIHHEKSVDTGISWELVAQYVDKFKAGKLS